MAFWRSKGGDPSFPKDDRGSGSLDDYDYNLKPKNSRVRLRLAGSAEHQDELKGSTSEGEAELTTAMPARNLDQERVDAPIEVRLFLGRRVSGVVGVVPRGLESVVDDTIRRLEDSGGKPRIPVEIVSTRAGLRVELLMGSTK